MRPVRIAASTSRRASGRPSAPHAPARGPPAVVRSPAPRAQPAGPDWGRPLALAGLALLALALLGRHALRGAAAANRGMSARTYAAIRWATTRRARSPDSVTK